MGHIYWLKDKPKFEETTCPLMDCIDKCFKERLIKTKNVNKIVYIKDQFLKAYVKHPYRVLKIEKI